MALMTVKEYIDSLRTLNTRVYMFGEKIGIRSICCWPTCASRADPVPL